VFSRYCVLAYILSLFRRFVQPLRIAVTGIPGCGKTTFCNYIKQEKISVLDLAKESNAILLESSREETVEIDLEKLNKSLKLDWKESPSDNLFIDGHLSHNLPVDCVILFRCRPDILEERLRRRKWSEEKIAENVECELLSIIINEIDKGISTLEVDTTNKKISETWNEVNEWLNGDRKTRMLQIDWIAELHS